MDKSFLYLTLQLKVLFMTIKISHLATLTKTPSFPVKKTIRLWLTYEGDKAFSKPLNAWNTSLK